MYLLIRYPAGVVIEGVVLATSKNRMRVISPSFPDTLELKRSGKNWILSNRYHVQLEFVMSRQCETSLADVPMISSAYAN